MEKNTIERKNKQHEFFSDKYTVVSLSLRGHEGPGDDKYTEILMMIYVWHQQRFDTYHTHYDRISRLVIDVNMPDGNSAHVPFTAGDIAGFVKDEVPSVETSLTFPMVRIYMLKLSYKHSDRTEFGFGPDFRTGKIRMSHSSGRQMLIRLLYLNSPCTPQCKNHRCQCSDGKYGKAKQEKPIR